MRILSTTAGLAVLALVAGVAANAADHADAPAITGDAAADLADLYAWTDGDQLVIAVTYAGFTAAGEGATYDPDVLYGVHLDTDGDAVAEHDIWVRFGQNDAGAWGAQFTGVPGTSGELVGAAGGTIQEDDVAVFTGVRDDPFFFDFTGFEETTSTGDLSFDSSRDSFAGTNVSAIVMRMDAETATGTDGTVAIWATSARK